MKKTIAAILALSFLTLTACGSMPEHMSSDPDAQQTELTTNADTTTDTDPDTDPDTETDATKATSTKKTETPTSADTTDITTNSCTSADATHASTAGMTANTSAAGTQKPVSTTAAGGNPSTGKATTKVTVPSTTKSGSSTTKTSTTTAKPSTTTTATTKVTTDAATTAEPTTEAPTEAPAQDGVTKIVNGVMVVNSGTDHPRAIELFSGNFNTATRYAQTLNSYKATLGDAVNVWCMVVPTSQAFYTPADVAGQYGNQLDHYNTICANFDGVTGIPVYETLDAHKDEQTYSRTDYHWQPLAAYYAAEQFAAFAGVPYAPLDTYTPVVREGYVGAFYRVNNVTELGNHPEQFTYYKPANLDACTFTYYNTAFGGAHQGSLFFENNSVNASYTVFVGSDECILEADTNVDNDRVLVIFKDSYGNALVPFLTQSFSKIYLCDFRYFDRNAASFIQEVGATDLLFAMSTVAVCTSSKVDKVANNLTK